MPHPTPIRCAGPMATRIRHRHRPLHRGLATFPNHFHDAGGRIVADPITHPDATPEDNLQKLIRALLDDPLLGVKDIA